MAKDAAITIAACGDKELYDDPAFYSIVAEKCRGTVPANRRTVVGDIEQC